MPFLTIPVVPDLFAFLLSILEIETVLYLAIIIVSSLLALCLAVTEFYLIHQLAIVIVACMLSIFGTFFLTILYDGIDGSHRLVTLK